MVRQSDCEWRMSTGMHECLRVVLQCGFKETVSSDKFIG